MYHGKLRYQKLMYHTDTIRAFCQTISLGPKARVEGWGLGFGVWGLWSRVEGRGLRVEGFRI